MRTALARAGVFDSLRAYSAKGSILLIGGIAMIASRIIRTLLACGVSLAACAAPALAQNAPDISGQAAADEGSGESGMIVVTGSRIKQDPAKSALPLQIITNVDLERSGISSAEQLNMYLTSSGSGADNLASNSDVTSGAQRGTNGLSSANLRGQGSAATLILLNGRRVAAHGLSGQSVDVNQIPFAAIDRIEVLKDGASAIYGTDAVGGVINYITKKNYTGLGLQGFSDVTEAGGGNIYRLSGVAGYGDLADQGFNVMGAVAYSWNQRLRGDQRSFVNGDQPNRGLSIDTRGTPIATVFNIGNNAAGSQPRNAVNPALLGTLTNGLTLTAPNGANAAGGGINILDLPGGAGCASMDGGMAYDELLWNNAAATYACAWDTGRAAALQQPIKTLTYYGRATVRLGGEHELFAEVTGSEADSAKSFSNNQLSSGTGNLPIAYPLNALTTATYNQVFNAIRAAFPANAAALDARYGAPIGFRWRCIPCERREYVTNTKTLRVTAGVEGPLPFEGWDYRAGGSFARSESSSVLGTGYFYRGTTGTGAPDPNAPAYSGSLVNTAAGPVVFPGIVGLINSGVLNPFSLTQSDAALAGLQAISAEGATLYGGRYKVTQIDGSVSGPLFALPGGDVQLAVGVDYRRETYEFNGSAAAAATAPVIFNAAFDNVNALTPKRRTIKAAYAEVLVPVFEGFELTGAVRMDDYSGFGTTTNPKVTAKFQPAEWVMLRASYNTSFRVPSFNQIFNGVTLSPYSGSDLADPVRCPGGVPTSAFGSGLPCAQIRPDIATGGNADLGPESADQYSVGVVLRPAPRWTFSADLWNIDVDGTIQTLSLRDLINNAAIFPERFIRDPASNNDIDIIDQRWINAGARKTRGVEFSARGGFDLGGESALSLGFDGTWLLRKKEQIAPAAPVISQLGVFSFAGDLGLKWKHNAWVNWGNDDWSVTLTQIFRGSYANQKLPGIAAGLVTRPDFNPRVKPYSIYHFSVSYLGLGPAYKLTMGVKNLFDTDPPFAITYDGNTGAGSSWEPRVADPRGRSLTVQAEVKF
jgi:iron complex outermembrane recepter protein